MISQADRQTTKDEEMQCVYQDQRINVESRARPGLRTVICWGQDWCRSLDKLRHQKLISFTRERASLQISLSSLARVRKCPRRTLLQFQL